MAQHSGLGVRRLVSGWGLYPGITRAWLVDEQGRVQASLSRRDVGQLLPDLLRAGALRFWISRLWDYHLPREAALLTPHDPRHFERVLRARITQPLRLK